MPEPEFFLKTEQEPESVIEVAPETEFVIRVAEEFKEITLQTNKYEDEFPFDDGIYLPGLATS